MTANSLRRIIKNLTKRGAYTSLPFMIESNGTYKIMWFEYDMKYSHESIDMLIRHIYTLDKDCTAVIKSTRIIEAHLTPLLTYDEFNEDEYYKKLIDLFSKDDFMGAVSLLRESESEESLSIYDFISGNSMNTTNQ